MPFFNIDEEFDPRNPRKATKLIKNTVKMETELRSFGKEVPGGYAMTAGDLARFFKSTKKKRF